MNIKLITIGKNMPAWVVTGFEEYAKRLPKSLSLELIEIPLMKRQKTSNIEQLKQKEAEKIVSYIGTNETVIALEVTGRSWSTEELATHLQSWREAAKPVCFVVGGPDGLDVSILDRAQQQWSLSKLTFPHPIVRMIFAEQLYRAWSIINQHPYHRA